jgi:Domain of unknown function (DUF4397)
MKWLRSIARLAAVPVVLAGFAAAAAAAAPGASAAPLAVKDGWVRIAHLSPEAPAMDMYLYSFGDPAHATVLKDVAYGDVSAYMTLKPGEYTVAMRGFDAPASSKPALVTNFMVGSGTAYTLTAMGPDPGLRVEVLKDRMTTPAGKTLVRVLQASLKQHQVTVSSGATSLAKQLTFGSATSYAVLSPGTHAIQLTASGGGKTESLNLTADTPHTIVILDGSSGLKVADLTDGVGTKDMPKGGAATGFGGMARPSSPDLVWLLLVVGGSLATVAGVAGLARPRRRRAPAHP